MLTDVPKIVKILEKKYQQVGIYHHKIQKMCFFTISFVKWTYNKIYKV